MTNRYPTERDPNSSRRRALQLTAATVGTAVAGCLSWARSNDPSSGTTPDENTSPVKTTDETFDPEQYQIGSAFLDDRSSAGTVVPELNEELEEWDAWAGAVSATTDEHAGHQDGALLLETDETQTEAIARWTFAEPHNFEDRSISIAVKWEEPTDAYYQVALTLRDESGDALELTQYVETLTLEGWHRYDLGVNAIEGEPDLSAIVTVDVMTWVDDVTSQVYVGDIRTTETATGSYVLLHFDDLFEGAYTNAFPILEGYGFKATGATTIGAIGADNYMSQDQISDLADHGWEFCSHPHAAESFAEMKPSTLDQLLAEYKAWHTDHGFDDGLDYIIYPYGEINDENLEVVSRYHKLGFKVPRAEYGTNITSPLLCGRATAENREEVKAAIDRATVYNTVVPIMFHDVGESEDWISQAGFEETIEYIDDADGIEVITTSEWLSLIGGDVNE
ncbi:polysaccharide deacetylase family protein [Saliphagus infecundisoli]|uniref:Polysaccharide deacetylase family protein n=1 Tax=Saliphagus infecundisoli TaxID=1849069 RepID=A0ABD5QHK4_9EURY|nr:polysaccharide deacetylase family protein [Saliphagus infecundisoli]